MAVTSPNQWTLASTGTGDFEVLTGPTSGNWLVAIVSWSVNDGSTQTCTVADTATNMWSLLFSPTTAAFVTGQGGTNATLGQTEIQNVQIWACPAAQYAGWPLCDVYVALTKILASDIGSVCVNIFELAGMGNGTLTVDSVTLNTATAATSFSVAAPAPAADCVMVAAAATDLNSATISFTAAGFTTLTQVSQNKQVNGFGAGYFNPDLRLTSAWVETTLAQTATWTSSAACNWAGLIVAFRQTGVAPPQPNSQWPATQFQVGFGVQAGTPPSAVRWTDQTSRLLEWSHTRGVAYLLGNAQSEPTDLQIRNDDGAYTPRAPGSATANAAGTATTLVCASTAVSGVNVGDFFQLKNSGGTLKEYTVFQVQSVSTVGATTTITFVKADERAGGGGALVATVSGDIFAAIPIDLFIPYRVLMTWQNKTYVVASGTLTDLPQLWINNHWGEVEAVAYDALLFPGKVELDSILRTEIFRNNPTHYWPLDDPQSSPVAQNIGSGSTQLVQTTSKFGAGSGTGAFGASTQGLASIAGQTTTIFGDGGTGWQATGLTSAQINARQGIALIGSGNDFPPVSGGVTISGVLYVPSADQTAITGSTTDPTVVIVRSANPGGGSATLLKVTIVHTTLASQVTVWDKVTKVPTATNGNSTALATAQFTSWAISFNQTHFYLYINGAMVASGTCNLGPSFNVIDVGGETDRFITGFCFGGIHSHIAVFPVMLSDTLQSNLSFATTTSFNFSNEKQIRRLIEASGYLGSRVLTPSAIQTTLPQQQSGNIIDQISAMVGYEDGLFFADSAGVFQYRSDTISAFQTSSATLGENTGAGEFPYLPEWGQKKFPFDAVYTYTVTKVSNTRQLSPGGGTVTSSLIARNPANFSKYGTLTLSKATLITNDWQAWNLSWWLLWQYQQPKLRLESLTFEAVRTSAGSLWPFLLGAEVGDVVTTNRRPIGAPPISTICRVLKVEVHAVPPEEYTVKLTMGPVRPQIYVCNDPTLGIVGSGAPTGNVIGM